MTTFIAFDVETANPNLASICQVGLAFFSDGKLVDTWKTYVNPEDYFDPVNVDIHGIDASMVRDAIKIPALIDKFNNTFNEKIIVHHTAFDRVSVARASEKYGVKNALPCRWIDSARVARRTWEKYHYSGYGLSNIANDLGISFKHHDALEDARVAGEIVLKAISETNVSLEDWIIKSHKPISKNNGNNRYACSGNPDGYLYGEVIVFTGQLCVPRSKASEIASNAGCDVGSSVTAKTTILVVGDQDILKLAGYEKSSKHRKAEELISKGQSLRILGETDFFKLLNIDDGKSI